MPVSSSATHIIGVDPGGRYTGIVHAQYDGLMKYRRFIASGTIHAPGDDALPVSDDYLLAVIRTVTVETERARKLIGHDPEGRIIVAIEGIVRPNLSRGKIQINPEPLLAAAIVFGAVRSRFIASNVRTVVIPPGDNGKGAFASYPPQLVSAAERRLLNWQQRQAGEGVMRHERSAFDVMRLAAIGTGRIGS